MTTKNQLGLFDEQPPPKKAKDPPAMRTLRRGRWFTAKRKSSCDSCGTPLSIGDRIWLVPYITAICQLCKYAHLPE